MKKGSGNTCAKKVWAGLARVTGLWRDTDTCRDRAAQHDAMVALVLLLASSKDRLLSKTQILHTVLQLRSEWRRSAFCGYLTRFKKITVCNYFLFRLIVKHTHTSYTHKHTHHTHTHTHTIIHTHHTHTHIIHTSYIHTHNHTHTSYTHTHIIHTQTHTSYTHTHIIHTHDHTHTQSGSCFRS